MSSDLIAYRQTSFLFLKSLATSFLIITLLAASGCHTLTESEGATEIDVKTALVSRDLLYALTQILPPDETTIQFKYANSDYGRELEKGLKELGYGMQLMDADHGPRYLTYGREAKSSNTGGSSSSYTVFVGDIGLERIYADAPGGGIAPLGPMNVHGSEVPIQLSSEIFPDQPLDVNYVAAEASKVDESAIVVVDQNVMDAISQLRTSPIPSYSALNFQKETVENVALRGKSNFTELDLNYRVVRKDIIIFPNDSFLLLDKGRQQISKMVGLYRPGTDVFRLIGCSHGPTSFKGGNESLALGRSERIAKELIIRKVSKADIRDEGCWAGESITDWPGRGVVIELQRKNS